MSENEKRKVLLSLKHVTVKFNVRGRILTAIRDVSLDVYEHESLAIVGESGSGKSVLTKTFAGMLETNGFIPEGSIIFDDEELSQTEVKMTPYFQRMHGDLVKRLNEYAKLERGAEEYRQIQAKEADMKHLKTLSEEEEEEFQRKLKDIRDNRVDTNNYLLTLDKRSKKDQADIQACEAKIKALTQQENELTAQRNALIKERTKAYEGDAAQRQRDQEELAALKAKREEKIKSSAAMPADVLSGTKSWPTKSCCPLPAIPSRIR